MIDQGGILAFLGLPAWVLSLAIAGISMGLSALMARKERSEDPNDNYAWDQQTTSRSGIAKERCYGTFLVTGNIIAQERTVVNTTQSRTDPPDGRPDWLQALISSPLLTTWLNEGIESVPEEDDIIFTILQSTLQNNVLIAWGEGPVSEVLSDPPERINDIDISTLGDVTVAHRLGTSVQTATGLGNTLEVDINQDAHVGTPVEIITTEKDYVDLAVVILMADGLGEYEDDGDMSLNALGVKIEIRQSGGSWHTLADHILYGRTTKALRMVYTASETYDGGSAFTVTQGCRHEVKVTCTQEDNNGDLEFGTLTVECIKEIYTDNPIYPGVALTAMSAMPSDQLSGNIAYKAVARHRPVRVYDGASWSIAYSANPAWVSYDRWAEPVIAGDGTGYTVDHYRGVDPSLIDTDEFKAYADWCVIQRDDGNGSTEDQFAFHGRFESPEERYKSADRVAAMSRARFWRDGQRVRCWIDKSTTPTFLVCRSNTYSYREHSGDTRRYPSVIEMDAKLAVNDYESVPVQCIDNTATHYHVERMDGFGMTATAQIRRLADFRFRKNRYCRLSNEWTGGPEFGDIEPGHVGYCADDNNNKTRSGRIIDVYADGVLLDITPSAQASGRTYSIVLQTFHPTDGRVLQRFDDVTLTGAVVRLAAGDSFSTVPEIGDCYIYAPEDNLDLYRVIGRDGTNRGRWSFVGEEYREIFYAGDSDAPILDTDIELGSVIVGGGAGGRVTRAEIERALPDPVTATPEISEAIKVTGIEFTGDGTSTVTWTGTGALQYGWVRFQGRVFPIREDATGTTSRYIYFDPDAADPTRLYGTNALSDLAGSDAFVLCINRQGTAHPCVAKVDRNGLLISEDDILAGAFNPWEIDETFEDASYDDFALRWMPINLTVIDTTTIASGGRYGGQVIQVVATSEAAGFIFNESMPVDIEEALYRYEIWVKLVSGSATIRAGVMGRNAADDDWVAYDGTDSSSSYNHYNCAADEVALTVGTWTKLVGFFRRTAATGTRTSATDANNPAALHSDVRSVRPFFYFNSGTYTVQIDRIRLRRVGELESAKSMPGAKHLTDDYEIPSTDLNGQAYDNQGATKDITILLRAATTDREIEVFNVSASYDIYLAVQSGETHLLGSTDQTMKLTGKGTGVRLGCNTAGIHIIKRSEGTTPTYSDVGRPLLNEDGTTLTNEDGTPLING